jgi:hypothetical protein
MQINPNIRTKPPMKLKAPEEPSLTRSKKQASIKIGNDAIKRKRLSLSTPVTRRAIEAMKGSDW